VILAGWVEFMCPAVAAHVSRLGVLQCLATAACWFFGWLVDGLVLFICKQLGEECNGISEAFDLAGHGLNFFCFGTVAVAKIGG
jgi:hypothetical protein